MEEQLQSKRYKYRNRFFIYAPPLKGVRVSKRKPPNPPYSKAPTWKTSVYYYWWAFLRRSDEYKRCCESGGKGKISKLYADFGNVCEEADTELDTFWNWWGAKDKATGMQRGNLLFAEPKARHLSEISSDKMQFEDDALTITVPLELRTEFLVNEFRKLLHKHDKRAKTVQGKSRAKYVVYSKPVLSALHTALVVYDAMKTNERLEKKKKLHELFDDIEGDLDNLNVDYTISFGIDEADDGQELKVNVIKLRRQLDSDKLNSEEKHELKNELEEYEQIIRRRKRNKMKRQQRIAEQYIANVVTGKFPKKEGR